MLKMYVIGIPLRLMAALLVLALVSTPCFTSQAEDAKTAVKKDKKKTKKKKTKKKKKKKGKKGEEKAKAEESKKEEEKKTAEAPKKETEASDIDSVFGKETPSTEKSADASKSDAEGKEPAAEAPKKESVTEPAVTSPSTTESDSADAPPAEAAPADKSVKESGEEAKEEEDVDLDVDSAEVEADVEVDASSDGAGGILATDFINDALAMRDRGINILTARTTRKGSLTLIVDHRPFKNLFSGTDAFHDYLGLDRGESLKVGLGLRYGIIDNLDFGFYRLNDGGTVLYDTYEFDLRYAILNQQAYYVNLMARAGLSWFSQEDADDAVGFFGQLFVDRIFFNTLLVGAGFTFHSDSSSTYKEWKEDSYSGAITGVVEWRALNWLAATGEIAASVFGFKQDYPAFSFGLKFLTHRHVFSILLSNTQYIAADGIVANAWRGGKDLIFGFQIIREFHIADY